MRENNTTQLLEDLDGGVFMQRLDMALREVAGGVNANRKQGKVSISIVLKPIGDSNQVQAVHEIKFTKPTGKGEATEKATTSTPLHVGVNGRLSLFPDQSPLFGEAAIPESQSA